MSIVLPFALVGGPFTRSTQIYVDLKDGVAAVWPSFLSLSLPVSLICILMVVEYNLVKF